MIKILRIGRRIEKIFKDIKLNWRRNAKTGKVSLCHMCGLILENVGVIIHTIRSDQNIKF